MRILVFNKYNLGVLTLLDALLIMNFSSKKSHVEVQLKGVSIATMLHSETAYFHVLITLGAT